LKIRNNEIFKVKKINLDIAEEKEEYENILNDKRCIVVRDEFSYDKLGRANITIWYKQKSTN